MLTITLTIANTRQMTTREFVERLATYEGISREEAAEKTYAAAKRLVDAMPRLAKARVQVPQLGQHFDEVG